MQGRINRIIFKVVVGILFAVSLSAQEMTLSQVTTHLTDQPLTFTKNMGQWPDSILFRTNANGAVMWFTKDGVYQQFFKRIPKVGQPPRGFDNNSLVPQPTAVIPDKFSHEHDTIETMMIKTTFVASNADVTFETGDMLEYKCNYFLGRDSSKWTTDVPNYCSITYKNIYSGIDLRYYGNNKRMEYDFIVSPGADPAVIKLRYDNVESITLTEDDHLIIETKWGAISEQEPTAHAKHIDDKSQIDARFQVNLGGMVSFSVDTYDSTQSLLVAPSFAYITFLGGEDPDNSFGITVDDSGNAYVVGETESFDFPVFDAYDSTSDHPNSCAFVTKIAADGGSLIFSTYFSGGDILYLYQKCIAVDRQGSVYLTGFTNSSDLPLQNPFDSTIGGEDVFVTKLSSSGNTLIYSTYLGGQQNNDMPVDIAVDQFGHAYIAGHTFSNDFPMQNPYDGTYNGNQDIFIAKFTSSGSALEFSSYLGGGGTNDECRAMAIDGVGDVYVTGYTLSDDFPLFNAIDSTFDGDVIDNDCFVTKLSPSSSSLIYSTYLGGIGLEDCYGIVADFQGNAFVTGYTGSNNFPIKNALDSVRNGVEAFITQFSPLGDSLIFSTFLGQSTDIARGIAVDAFGNIYVTGYTFSSTFPMKDAYDSTFNGGADAFVTKLSANGAGILYSTYLGGSSNDHGMDIAINQSGRVCVVGFTNSSDFPYLNAFDNTLSGNSDAFIVAINDASASCCVGIRGDVNNSGTITILDLNYLVNYSFKNGPDPLCPDEANVNGISTVNILDLNYLVAYIFAGGLAPVACP